MKRPMNAFEQSAFEKRMPRVRTGIIALITAILTYQLFVLPIVGLANQGDFARIIGRFGYGPEDKSDLTKYKFLTRKYVPDPSARIPALEQFTSEYFFVASALLLNQVVSKDGKLDIVSVS